MLLDALRSVRAPLISLTILMLCAGIINTLTPIRLHDINASAFIVSCVSSAYYAGVVIGAFHSEHFITRVGHIRAFACFASLFAVTIMLQGLLVVELLWISLRFVAGFCIAGLFITIESWMLATSTPSTRGKILAIYMVALYGSQAIGQFLLNYGDITTIFPFCIATVLCSLAVIPISFTYVRSPHLEEPSALNFRSLYRLSPTGIIGCFCAGMILGAIYGFMPYFASLLGYSTSQITWIVGATLFGGMALQYPIGQLSDVFDRRSVLIVTAFLAVVSCVLLILNAHSNFLIFIGITFLFGGFCFALYPLSISHTCDMIDNKDIVAATQGLLLAYGVGATTGPLLVPPFLQAIGPLGFFVYFILISGFLGGFFAWRKTQRSVIPSDESQEFVAVAATSPISSELNTRSESSSEEKNNDNMA